MGSLFEGDVEDIRILDPGAGAGVLFAAAVGALISKEFRPKSVEVLAYESDKPVIPYLNDTIVRCELACRDAGISFRGKILAEDFIAAGVAETDEGLFAGHPKKFTHAILNPPYKKINGQSETRKLLNAAGMGVSNLYAAFVWLAARMLKPGGELVAITPRSFCNGPYFRRFRVALLGLMILRQIHVFESRNKAFRDDDVLQENIIFHAIRGVGKPKHVTVSSSEGVDFSKVSFRRAPYEHLVLPKDRDGILHLMLDDADLRVKERMEMFRTSLTELGLDVSTGRVVDFRARDHLRLKPENGALPLVYPCHFENGFVHWPAKSGKKPNAIVLSDRTSDLLVPAGHYVLTKRFTSKEERRRVVAAIYDPDKVEAQHVGFENHLNYFHARGAGLSPNLAKGLAVFLNSSLFDQYFRLFSGHTQVNATDLRKIRYPSRDQLMRLGRHVKHRLPAQETVDTILKKECEDHN
jgi:adenine-specific DNA-methyltransferase